tara:strand:+ start:799 stop:1650 length:852 start_codon:yes stop_codon:yes gene_type:complete
VIILGPKIKPVIGLANPGEKMKYLRQYIRQILLEKEMGFLDKVGHYIDTNQWGNEKVNPRKLRHPKLNTVVDAVQDAIGNVSHKEMKNFLWGLNHDFANGIKIESKIHLLERSNFIHKGGPDYFRVELSGIGYAEGGEQLRFKECQSDVDILKQTPEYIAAKEKFEANNTTKDMIEDPDSPHGYSMKERPAKFRPRFYEVNNAWISNPENRGKGYGKEIYKAFIDQAVEYSKRYGGVFVGAHACTMGGGSSPFSGGTSEDAQRVWKSLGRDYNSSGMVIFIGL